MSLINSNIHSVTAFAPATCANVAVGFDILGFALQSVGDQITLTKRPDHKIVIESIDAEDMLPFQTEKNTAGVVLQKICHDLQIDEGFSLQIKKGIPLSSGLGGSAASAVAALTAFNAFLSEPLAKNKLAQYALYGELLASGQQHADNIVPALFGGLLLIRSLDPIEYLSLPIPDVYCVIVNPKLHIETKAARKLLTEYISLTNHVKQSANLATFIAALYENNNTLLKECLVDQIIEHQRAHLFPEFYKLKQTALDVGALAFSFSGSGPALFAFAKNQQHASEIKLALMNKLQSEDLSGNIWLSPINPSAAQIIKIIESHEFY